MATSSRAEAVASWRELALIDGGYHVSVEWLKGETDEYETDITDKRELQIRDAMTSILNKLPYDMEQSESDFSKDLDLCSLEKSHTPSTHLMIWAIL